MYTLLLLLLLILILPRFRRSFVDEFRVALPPHPDLFVNDSFVYSK